jgi:hypothetical protein
MSFSLVPQPAIDRKRGARQSSARAASEECDRGRSGTFEGLVELLAVLGDGRHGGGDGERRHCVGGIWEWDGGGQALSTGCMCSSGGRGARGKQTPGGEGFLCGAWRGLRRMPRLADRGGGQPASQGGTRRSGQVAKWLAFRTRLAYVSMPLH